MRLCDKAMSYYQSPLCSLVEAEAKDVSVPVSLGWTENSADSERREGKNNFESERWNDDLSPKCRAYMVWTLLGNDPDLRTEASIRNICTYTWSLASPIRGDICGYATTIRF